MSKTEARAELVNAAQAVEEEVRRLEDLAAHACRSKLNTEKGIARAAKELQETMEQQERLAVTLRAFGEVIVSVQRRQHAALEPINQHASQIQKRMTRLAEHMQSYGALGVKANDLAKLLQGVASARKEGDTPEEAAEERRTRLLVEVEQRFSSLLEEAKALAELAREEEYPDVEREADALKQKMQAMRSRLSDLVRPAVERAN
jgi:DNA repair exonuclease SbcCD ATPase subunit